jgi:hypothetical protein
MEFLHVDVQHVCLSFSVLCALGMYFWTLLYYSLKCVKLCRVNVEEPNDKTFAFNKQKSGPLCSNKTTVILDFQPFISTFDISPLNNDDETPKN